MNTRFRQKVSNIFESFVAVGIQLERLTSQYSLFLVYDNGLSPRVVEIPKGSTRWVFPTANFLAKSPLRIFGKRIHIVFALSKGDIEHELTLWRTLKPECREFESTYTPCIEEIDNFSAVHTIASQSIGIPRNYA